MTSDLSALLGALAGRHVAVIGDALLDSYLEGYSERLCREAPVPNVTVTRRTDIPGGAANAAINVASLGGRVSFLTAVGDDPEGDLLCQALRARGVATGHVLAQPGRRTPVKHRVLAGAQLLLRFDQGGADDLGAAAGRRFFDRLDALFPAADAVLVSDYGLGVVTPAVVRRLAELQARRPRVVVADSRRRLAAFRPVGVTAVKPNYEEAAALLGPGALADGGPRAAAVARSGDRLLDLTGARVAAVTLDCDGAVVCERGRPPYHIAAPPARRPRVAGAGDTFVSVLALALAAGLDTPAMAELAAAAAAVVVAKDGTAACSADELREALSAPGKCVRDRDRLAARLAYLRRQGRRVVFTNGCFDLLHRGHVAHLHQAKALGDVLVVGVNSDAGARRLKGPGRPVNALEDRLQVLAALDCVDHLIDFDGDTACDLIRALRPDVFVKGGDYAGAPLPEAPLVEALGGAVHILPYLPHRSTAGLIDRIRGSGGPAGARGRGQLAEVT